MAWGSVPVDHNRRTRRQSLGLISGCLGQVVLLFRGQLIQLLLGAYCLVIIILYRCIQVALLYKWHKQKFGEDKSILCMVELPTKIKGTCGYLGHEKDARFVGFLLSPT